MLNMSDVFKMLMAAVARLNTDSELFQNYAILYPLLSSAATVCLVLVDDGCHVTGEDGSREHSDHNRKLQEAGKSAVWGTS
jgi:alpha-D-ribose 1-methylphosphonate 5-triphosphate synthase subunit PhnH